MSKELRKYGIRRATKPQRHGLLSGVVRVCDEGRGVAYVKFNEDLVDAVGKVLPYGVSPDSPAYLKAIRIGPNRWRVYAMYVTEEAGALLWEASDTPPWLTKVKRSSYEQSEAGSAGRA